MQSRNHYDVVISGMGPAGLSAALEALNAGKSVCLMDKRKHGDYTRKQKVFLEAEQREYLTSMCPPNKSSEEDRIFLKKLNKNYMIPITEIENFLLRRVKSFQKEKDNRLKIYNESSISDIDIAKGNATIDRAKTKKGITINKRKDISFDCAIDATGVSHHVTNIANRHLSNDKKIKFKKDAFSFAHQYHVNVFIPSITYTSSAKSVLTPDKPKTKTELKNENSQIIVRLDAQGLYQGIYLERQPTTTIECTINCELPKKLYDEYMSAKAEFYVMPEEAKQTYINAANQIKNFIEQKLKKELDRNDLNIAFEKDEYDAPKFNVFLTDLHQAEKSAIQKSGKSLILIGDANRTPYYPLGHGINDALLESKALREFFQTNNLSSYQKLCKSLTFEKRAKIAFGSVFKKNWNNSAQTIYGFFEEHRAKLEQPKAHLIAANNDLNVQQVESLIKDNLIYAKNIHGENIFNFIINRNESSLLDTKIFKYLLTSHLDVCLTLLAQEDNDHNTPVHYLISSNNQKLNEFLMDNEKLVKNFRDRYNNNLAHIIMTIACYGGDPEPKLKLLEIIWNIDKNLFLEKNEEGADPIDIFCNIYKNTQGDTLKKQLDQILNFLKSEIIDDKRLPPLPGDKTEKSEPMNKPF